MTVDSRKMQPLSSNDYDLTFLDLLRKEENSLSALYPDIPDHYFDENTNVIVENTDTIIDKYNNMPVKPFVRKIDLNNLNESDDNKSNDAWQIGLNIEF